MPVAYSGKPIIHDSLRADTAAHTIADLHAILLLAGWQVNRALTGGWVYDVTSPQITHYACRVLVQDNINYKLDNPSADLYNFPSVVIKFYNVAETISSFDHQLRTNGDYPSLQCIAGRCQLFISLVGSIGLSWSSFAGGIPFVPIYEGSCTEGLTPPAITDLWWTNGGSQFGFDWRTQFDCYACMSYYLNGVVVIAPDNNTIAPDSGFLALVPLIATNVFSHNQIPWPSITYSSHKPLVIDALVVWDWQIHGQLWDAFLLTAAGGLDVLHTYTDEYVGASFNVSTQVWHSNTYSSLVLILEVLSQGAGNVAY